MKSIIYLITCIMLIFFSSSVTGQTVSEYNQKGLDYYNKGEFETALTYFEKAIAKDKTNGILLMNKSDALHRIGANKNDKQILQKALSTVSSALDYAKDDNIINLIYHRKGLINFSLQNYDQALSNYSKALELGFKEPFVYFDRAKTYFQTEKYEEARMDLDQAIRLKKDDENYYLYRGVCLTYLEKYEEARMDLDRAVKMNPNIAAFYFRRASLSFRLKQYSDAINDLNQAINLNSKAAELFRFRGFCYYSLKRYEEAIENYNKAIEINPSVALFYLNRGLVYRALEQYEKAIEDYNKVISLDPDSHIGYNYLGIIYYDREEYELALENFKKAETLAPEIPSNLGNVAIGLAQTGKFSEAFKKIELALNKENPSGTLWQKARIYALAGETEIAYQSLKLAFEKGFEPTDFDSRKKEFSSLYLLPKFKTLLEANNINTDFIKSSNVKPPILSMLPNSLRFIDSNGNNAIDADERCQIEFEMTNVGIGDGYGLVLRTEASGSSQGLSFEQEKKLEVLKVKDKVKVVLPILAQKNTIDGKVLFTFKVEEPNGFGSERYQIEVTTNAFVEPLIRVVDYSITSDRSTLQRRFPFDLQVLIQNTQYGLAEKVNVSLSLPSNVFPLSNNINVQFDQLEAGQTKEMVYNLIVNDRYEEEEIPVVVNIKEKHGQYAQSKTITLQLNQNMASNKIVVDARKDDRKGDIEIASLRSDVDKGIPQVGQTNSHRYALIIGNEDYSSYQTGLSTEVNVDYAVNDAAVFKEYAVNTLGIPERQVHLLTNATTGQINQGLAWLANLARTEQGKAELIFYYSGHGLPKDNTDEAYLFPVDVSGVNIEQAIQLKKVYTVLTEYPAQKVTVFLDACFSGGARNEPLVAMKGLRRKPRAEALKGNTVVFSSSSGEEASGVYRDKQHGFFTYFLLKKLKESRGEVTYQELFDYIQRSVGKESGLISKPQTPDVQVSEAVKDTWRQWRMN